MATTGIGRLPLEILEVVFEILSPNTVYEKLIKPYIWGQWNHIQEVAYSSVFSQRLVIQSHNPTRAYNPSRIFYAKPEAVLTLKGFDHAYFILRKLINFNLETGRGAFPSEIGMLLHFTEGNSQLIDELDYFIKLVEVLSFDNYYRQSLPKISIQILYEVTLTPELAARCTKLMHMIEVLGKKTHKLLIINRFQKKTQANRMSLVPPSIIQNLHELYLWNNFINDFAFKHYLSSSPTNLRVLDVSANLITSLEDIKLPTSLEYLLLGANSLTTLKGPDMKSLTRLRVLDASVNAISDLDGLELPDSLKVFKFSYNFIQYMEPGFLPDGIEMVVLSKNSIARFSDDFVLPSTTVELHLNANGFKSLPSNFFIGCHDLSILDFSDNNIDDLDELGKLPSSIRELTLDNNEIDYSNYSNILTDNLEKLSMNSTGLVEISNIRFGAKLEILNLSRNEISSFRDLEFGSEEMNPEVDARFRRLDISHNKLTSFNLPGDNIKFPPSLEFIDLSHNLFHGIDSICLPANLTTLILKVIPLNELSNGLLSIMPRSLKELRLDQITWSEDSSTKSNIEANMDFSIFPNLQTLTLDHNKIPSTRDFTYPSGLSHLSLKHNQIRKLDFENIPTNIEYLQLNDNPMTLKEISCCRILYTLDGGNSKVEIADIPYFPHIKYFGLCGDSTELMKSGLFYGKLM